MTQTTEPQVKKPSIVVNEVVWGPFEKIEEGIGIAIDKIKVKGEDPATPRSLRGNKARWHVGNPFHRYVLLGPTLMKPRDRNDEYRVDKTTQHTHIHTVISIKGFPSDSDLVAFRDVAKQKT